MTCSRSPSCFLGPLLAAAALACSCDNQPVPAGPAASPAQPSLHAAMRDTPSPAASTGARTADALPPGHPPVGPAPGAPATPPAPAAAASGGERGMVAQLARIGVAAQVPPGWTEVPSTSAMRMATLRIPGTAGDADGGEMSIMLSGGSLDSNIDRWRGQFTEKPQPVTTRLTPGGLQVTVVEMEGTFSAGTMGGGGGPQPGTKLLGAIVAVPGQQQSLFLKSWGPKATMEQARAGFDALIGSLKLAR